MSAEEEAELGEILGIGAVGEANRGTTTISATAEQKYHEFAKNIIAAKPDTLAYDRGLSRGDTRNPYVGQATRTSFCLKQMPGTIPW